MVSELVKRVTFVKLSISQDSCYIRITDKEDDVLTINNMCIGTIVIR